MLNYKKKFFRMLTTDTYDITPDKSLVKKLGMAGYRTSQALAELIDNSIDARVPGKCQDITVRLDFKHARIIIEDNGTGMNDHELADAMTIAKESHNINNSKLGRFGIGMKSACSALGKRFDITTSRGDGTEYHTRYDEKEWLADDNQQGWKNQSITRTSNTDKKGDKWHGTKIVISNLSIPLYPNQVSNLKENFGIRYSPYLESGNINLSINTVQCRPIQQDVEPDSTINLQVPLGAGKEITGQVALLKKRSISGNYGIHLFWRGILIRPFAKVGFRSHPENAKIIGSINLDHVPVNYTKNGFLEDSAEYVEAVRKLAASEQMRLIQRKSAMSRVKIPPIRSVFEHAVANIDDGYKMDTRVRADISAKLISTTKPFTIEYDNGKKIHVRIEHNEPNEPIYVADTKIKNKKEIYILINANSEVFRFAKNPLFLIMMIASESRIMAQHPETTEILNGRNYKMAELLSCKLQQDPNKNRQHTSGKELWRQKYAFAKSGNQGISPELVEAHDILVDRHEFKFQFTALSTLSSYLHDLGGKLVYTIHTIPPHGEEVVELLTKNMGDGFVVVDRPSTDTIDALLQLPNIQRVLAVREYSQITGSTIASPAKAFVDLMRESSGGEHTIIDSIGLRRILESMLRLDVINIKDVKKYAKASKCTKLLDVLLEEALQV